MGRAGCRKAQPNEDMEMLKIQRKQYKGRKTKNVKDLSSNMNLEDMNMDSNNNDEDSFALVDLDDMTATPDIKKKKTKDQGDEKAKIKNSLKVVGSKKEEDELYGEA